MIVLVCPECGREVTFWSSVSVCKCGRRLMIVDSFRSGCVAVLV